MVRVAESGLAEAASIDAARHGLIFCRANRDRFRRAKCGDESADLPSTTRQQDTKKASKVGRNVVLPVVHRESSKEGDAPSLEKNLIWLRNTTQ